MKDDVCCHWGGGSKTDGGGRRAEKKTKKDTKREFSLESSHESARSLKVKALGSRVCFSEDFDGDGQSE